MDVRHLFQPSLVALCLLSGTAQAHVHGAAEESKSFIPAPPGESYEQTLLECVSEQDQLLSGLGGTRYPMVALKDADKVEAFYSQGIALQYGFNFSEAIRAFYQASRADEGSAMPYWGIALSANSNINSDATAGCDRTTPRHARTISPPRTGSAHSNCSARSTTPTPSWPCIRPRMTGCSWTRRATNVMPRP